MTDEPDRLVLDTGPLSHLAEAGWLGILRSVSAQRVIVISDAVHDELRRGSQSRAHLRSVLEATWIEKVSLSSESELQAFGYFASRLVSGDRNVGEAEVLAYAQIHGAVAVIDDGAARRAARDAEVRHRGTLGLLCEAVRDDLLTVTMVSQVADHLLETEYRLPFGPGGFERWASENGLLG